MLECPSPTAVLRSSLILTRNDPPQTRKSDPPAADRDDDGQVPAEGVVGALWAGDRAGARAEAVVPHVNVRSAKLEGGRAK